MYNNRSEVEFRYAPNYNVQLLQNDYVLVADNDTMKIGGLISTNNLIVNKEVVVHNTQRLLWTMSHTLVDDTKNIVQYAHPHSLEL